MIDWLVEQAIYQHQAYVYRQVPMDDITVASVQMTFRFVEIVIL